MFLLINCLIVNTLTAACSASQTNCAEGQCDTVGGTEICITCQAGHVPINGKCTAKAEATNCKKANGSDLTEEDTKCGKCEGATFMYKGGCYEGSNALGQAICQAAGVDGVCETCNADNGYFKNPEAAATVDSCISCGDATGVTTGNSGSTKTYKGVDGCAKCTKPSQISENTGTAVATCTECNANLYLKTVTGSSTETSCVTAEDCKTGYFPNDNVENKKKCILCNTVANGGITNCGECSLLTPASRAGNTLITCSACSSDNLSPLKNECMTTCPAGTYETGSPNKVCTPCHTSCAGCKDDNTAASCTACYPGYVLSKTDSLNTGTCIPECTGRYAENCEAGMCTAVLGGSKYCSRCAAGYAPIDGMCTKVATTSRDASVCTASGGVCTACTGANYALLSGGCYNTKVLPGSAVCTQAGGNGQCTTCANGQSAASGNCPACAEGCSACTNGNTQQCTACLAGYYKSGSKCFKCTADSNENNNAITGVPNCVSCAAPTSNTGTVTCYVTQTPTVDPADPSVNKGGLPSGAIAGISVAVIVVVGGLVGFLCWWFICRGKA